MAVPNPFSITYGGRQVGGSSAYQLHGPYVIDKSFEALRLVFDVVVVATDAADLQQQSETLEDSFRRRLAKGDSLVIDLDGSSWTYTVGSDLLKTTASIAKTGNPDTDKALSRAYTVTIQGELPASDQAGLRDLEILVDYAAGRQKTVTMRGTYTATSAGDAVARYKADFDAEAQAYLTAIGSQDTYELVDESYSMDRERTSSSSTTPASHLCNFTRQYIELLANQSQALKDDPQIRDHRVIFTDLSQHPGDGKPGIQRLRRVVGSYDCAVDITQTTDLAAVFENKVKRHVRELFRANFEPSVFAVEEQRVSYDETAKRISVSLQFIYQASGSEALVEVSQSVAFREARNIDYTPTHDSDEFSAEADVGWASLERVWNRTAIVVGRETPKLRIIETPRAGDAGLFTDNIGGQAGPDTSNGTNINGNGWNIIASTSQVTPQWIGSPDDEQIEVQVLTETVVERYHRRPTRRGTTVPIQRGPTTGSRG